MHRVANDTSALTRQDQRYEEIFDVEKETTHSGGVLIDDLYPKFAALRTRGSILAGDVHQEITGVANPTTPKGRPHYATLDFETTNKALMDNATYSSLHYHEMPSVMQSIGHTILTMVGNEHGRYRSSIQPMMTRQQAMGWWREKWIEPFVGTLVDDIGAQQDGADLALALCARLPMHTVTAAYGLGSAEALDFRNNLLASMSARDPAEQAAAQKNVRAVLIGAITERRRERRDDLISRLIDSPFTDAEGRSTHLSDEDILSFSRLLLLAGGGTTFRQMGILIFALFSHRDQLEDLRADRGLMPAAIEESVRWECTDPLFHRLATKDSVLGGTEIPEGALIDVCLGAGNRDPKRWDDPDRYDLHRPEKRHVGFAAGPHTCLGRFVAAAEMGAAVNALLDRLPRLRLDDRGEPTRIIGGLQARGVNHLRVRFD
jgi:cytochrome P450